MNPYKVLGVSEDADMETIKKAYRELVKKYHPDKYVNNPLADLASEKLKEINEAYDMIESGRAGNSYNNSRSSYSGQSRANNTGANNTNASFQAVRAMITNNRLAEAEQMLGVLPHDAEWYYLMGLVYIKKGWHSQGIQYIQTAVRLEPNNLEYVAMLNNFRANTTQYRGAYSTGTGGGEYCNCCSQLICADCCCECLGGDLISCC